MLRAIIVDDELNARINLTYLLKTFCSDVKVVAEASNVDTAVEMIKNHQPDLVFLDISMPEKNGFQLVHSFKEINFQIIFITAYDQYALKAFEVSALDYLLKPIEVDRLKNAVQRAKAKVDINNRLALFNEQYNKNELTKIAIPANGYHHIIEIDNIACIEASGSYSNIHSICNEEFLTSKKLNYYEKILTTHTVFIRIHRSWIVNINHLEFYSKKERIIILKNHKKIPVGQSFKEYFEKSLNLLN